MIKCGRRGAAGHDELPGPVMSDEWIPATESQNHSSCSVQRRLAEAGCVLTASLRLFFIRIAAVIRTMPAQSASPAHMLFLQESKVHLKVWMRREQTDEWMNGPLVVPAFTFTGEQTCDHSTRWTYTTTSSTTSHRFMPWMCNHGNDSSPPPPPYNQDVKQTKVKEFKVNQVKVTWEEFEGNVCEPCTSRPQPTWELCSGAKSVSFCSHPDAVKSGTRSCLSGRHRAFCFTSLWASIG